MSRILARTSSAIHHADEVLSHASDASLPLEHDSGHTVNAGVDATEDNHDDNNHKDDDDDDTLSYNSQVVINLL